MSHATVKPWLTLGLALGLGLILSLAAGLALADTPGQGHLSSGDTLPPLEPYRPPSSLVYAHIITGGVPVYQQPLAASQGLSPTRLLQAGYVWVTLAQTQPVQYENQDWYMINPDEYVPAENVEIYQPSPFHGVAVSEPKTFAWVVFDAWTSAAPGEAPGQNSLELKRYTLIPIEESQFVGERTWYRLGGEHWLEQGMIALVSPKPRPEGIGPGEKWIEVDLYEQTLAAYEGERLVYATLVSSGLAWWPTQTGLFRIWVKVDAAKMSGREGYPDYYSLEDVPWTMYFNHGFALHGAYWHDSFGRPHSHGCINLSLADAHWLFDWTGPTGRTGWSLATDKNPGTWVWVHE
jgi:hypothetical protein